MTDMKTIGRFLMAASLLSGASLLSACGSDPVTRSTTTTEESSTRMAAPQPPMAASTTTTRTQQTY